MPELRHLRAFVAVAETRSFTRAGERLHLQQQSVSRTIGELERELGVELFERTTREVRLTAAGAALQETAPGALQAAEEAFGRARDVGAGLAGVIRFGVTPAIGPQSRDDIVRALRSAPGELSVAIHEVRPADLPARLTSRDLEFVVSSTAGRRDPALHAAELRPTPLVAILPAGHRLATRPEIAAQELDGEQLLLASAAGTPYTDLIVDRLAAAGARVSVLEARITGGSSLLLELAGTDAIALQPAGVHPPDGYVRVPVAALTAPLWLLWPAGLPSPATQRVRAQLAAPAAPAG